MKASKRYSNFARSLIRVILKKDASKFQLPGPLKAFRPSFPNAPSGAFTNDAVFKYSWLKAAPEDDSGLPTHVHAFIGGGVPIEHRVHSRIYRQHVAADIPKNSVDLPALSELADQAGLPGKWDLRQERREKDLPVVEIRRSVLGSQD